MRVWCLYRTPSGVIHMAEVKNKERETAFLFTYEGADQWYTLREWRELTEA